MKNIIAILLLISFTFECFSQLTLIAGFELNRSYIAQHLCVNRDNPSMHCDGKCFLEKELHQNQQRKNQESANTNNLLALPLFCPDTPFALNTDLESRIFIFDRVKNRSYTTPYFKFFHPPLYKG